MNHEIERQRAEFKKAHREARAAHNIEKSIESIANNILSFLGVKISRSDSK